MSDLTPDVAALLAAVVEALDAPMSHWDPQEERVYTRVLTERASVARIALGGILDGHDIPSATAWIAARTAEVPVTYRVYVPDAVEEGDAL